MSAVPADIDGDGDIDIVSGRRFSASIRWHENVDGLGRSWVTHLVSTPFILTCSLATADLDGDGDADVVATHPIEDTVAWYENLHHGTAWVLHVVLPAADDPRDAVIADMDGDGDGDIVATGGATVVWLHNTQVDGAWENLFKGLAGSQGKPCLVGEGSLVGGTAVTLSLSNALANARSTLVIGLSAVIVPFHGGILVPSPEFVLPGLLTDSAGDVALSATWPTGLAPGLTTYFQSWIVDPTGPHGFAASNAVKGTVP